MFGFSLTDFGSIEIWVQSMSRLATGQAEHPNCTVPDLFDLWSRVRVGWGEREGGERRYDLLVEKYNRDRLGKEIVAP